MESENVNIVESNSSSQTPATAQEVREVKLLTSVKEAKKVLSFNLEKYSDIELLTHFQNSILPKLEKHETKDLKQMIDAKNLLLRPEIERQVEQNGKFTLNIPFETSCTSCCGTGERYKFFKKIIEVECKFCDKGELIITCPACKGSGRYIKDTPDLKINVKCKKCNKVNEKTDEILVGKIKVKCRTCRGSGKFSKLVIDSYIKSTTYCKDCRGKGFRYKKVKEPDNPVIPANIGQEIKNAVATE